MVLVIIDLKRIDIGIVLLYDEKLLTSFQTLQYILYIFVCSFFIIVLKCLVDVVAPV